MESHAMIRQLFDPANAITAAGLILSVIGISFAMSGQLEMGVAIVLWALLADHLDGVVAKRTINRPPKTAEIGKNMDSLADLVSAGVFPAVVLITIGHASIFDVVVGACFVLASVLRLAYFNVFGSPDGRFIGVPTTYAVPVTAIVFLLRPIIPEVYFDTTFALVLIALGTLHVLPVRIPKTSGVMYIAVTVFCIASSATLATKVIA